jgi:4-hydroxy-4-methyl-2-oxoglutarate aldolase
MSVPATIQIRRNFKRPDKSIIDKFDGAPTSNVGDAQGREGSIDYGIKPVSKECSSFAGPALTVSVLQRDNLAAHAVMKFIQPGDVLVVQTRDCLGGAVFGAHMAGQYKNCGVIAIVTDGLIRDIKELEEIGIPVFARGASPNGPHKNGPGSVGMDVTIGGVIVRSGDMVVGDCDGVIVVPQENIQDTLTELDGVLEIEATLNKEVKAGSRISSYAEECLAGENIRYID